MGGCGDERLGLVIMAVEGAVENGLVAFLGGFVCGVALGWFSYRIGSIPFLLDRETPGKPSSWRTAMVRIRCNSVSIIRALARPTDEEVKPTRKEDPR